VRELIANTIDGLSYGKVLANIASVFILGLGVIAALNQIGVATTVTTPILVTVLATVQVDLTDGADLAVAAHDVAAADGVDVFVADHDVLRVECGVRTGNAARNVLEYRSVL